MVPGLHRPAYVQVDLGAIKQNIVNEMKHLAPGQKLFAVVKANAYGHGSVPVAKTALAAGASGFCVAILDEALELRRANIAAPILVLGVVPAKEAPIAAANGISLTAPSAEWLAAAKEQLAQKAETFKLKVHLGVDSGMGRIGANTDEEFLAMEKLVVDNSCFDFEGVFTHFASADSSDDRYFKKQAAKFKHMVGLLHTRPKWIHCDNTAASIFDKDLPSDLVRFGIGIYGLNPSSTPTTADLPSSIPLKPALSVESELTMVKTIHAGDGVGYGSTFVAERDTIIGTVPVGYADGWVRGFQGFKVKVGDKYCPIVGRVCMDQFMVELPEMMPAGTKVELISADPAAPNSIKKAADHLGTIHYEVACLLSDRLPRVYRN
ncbi:alanine racemase [Lactobacillus corticis]|uniref:Alanine racemase n=1 Tax=Lactobacillus corticis TaxID=2201249 RepID=A0A916VHA6_9LACO|nr:alanine racemase [Lactobacillus corticis]GFZ26836.1 alanine racemase [Lactobacillus corticis]